MLLTKYSIILNKQWSFTYKLATWLYISLYLMVPFISYFGVDETGVKNSEWLSITQLLLKKEENNDKNIFSYQREGSCYFSRNQVTLFHLLHSFLKPVNMYFIKIKVFKLSSQFFNKNLCKLLVYLLAFSKYTGWS